MTSSNLNSLFSHVSGVAIVALSLAIASAGTVLVVVRNARLKGWLEDAFFNSLWRFDATVGVVSGAALFAALRLGALESDLAEFLKSDGTSAYGALLSSFAALLGFSVTTLAIVCTVLPSIRLERRLTESQRDDFVSAFTLAIRSVGASTIASLLALFLNRSSHLRESAFFAVAIAVAVTIPSLVRAGLSLESVVHGLLKGAESVRTHRPTNPPVVP